MRRIHRALVTGGNGFIGRRLVKALLERSVQVVVLDLPGSEVPTEWGKKVELVRGDIRELRLLQAEIGPVDTVFHLAAIVSDWGAQQHHVDVTVDGTVQALELAANNAARFVVTTSVAAYASELGSGKLREEGTCGRPASPYEFVKQEQERVTREAANTQGIETVIVRPGNVYGVGSGPWVKTMVEMMSAGKPVLIGDGGFDAGLCHVDNLVSLLCLCGESPDAVGEVFNAADGFGVTWKAYLGELAEIYGLGKPKRVPSWLARILAVSYEACWKALGIKTRPPLTRMSLRLTGGPNEFSIDKARGLLGYEPSVLPAAGMSGIRATTGG